MHVQGMKHIKEIRKIKPHQNGEGVHKSWEAVANDWADFNAQKGRHLHDQPTDRMVKHLAYQVQDLSKVVPLLLEVFTLWPSQVKADRSPAGNGWQPRPHRAMSMGTCGSG